MNESEEITIINSTEKEEFFTYVKTYYVHESVKDQIPKTLRIFRPLSGGFSQDIKWSKSSRSYKLKSVQPAKGEGPGFLEVVYERTKILKIF